MTLLRMDNILIVVDDLKAAIAFFAELGMELEGETTVEGPWVDRIVGLRGVRSDIATMRTPDGHGRIELDKEGQGAELFLYPGDQHYFADNSLPSYDPEATALLTERVLEFLARV